MANQVYAAYSQQQNRGTLSPGQTIVINQYTVQVDRYLSQGGFAHVYVVHTANPINNTTQHVLKRIAVADEPMLREVRKEVDIMRLLRGHPNIVNFIDASWNQLPNGMFEALILMELCPGGGIIDMMNRRLRERLTEAEILQIFVDVCEAVAVMHNLKPPLLHRDLKVENILQASATRYKLCDFGSATPVAPRPPSSIQEIRALETDLSKHTTLQYRAPEMVDVHLRRPVDEKSDVWALGVLLYKLCYYTTPFEEHGPLAILNVQYRIPPYPVYSTQMNSLIASMLRELGAQRPSVFEVLDLVHHMRGSKSQYRYNVSTQQLLRPPQHSSQPGLGDIIAFRSPPVPGPDSKVATQARQTVLEAIAPMRRGRPSTPQIPNYSSSEPRQGKEQDIRQFEEKWNVVKAEASENVDKAWDAIGGKTKDHHKAGFGNDSVGFGDSFTDFKVDNTVSVTAASPSLAVPWLSSNPRSDTKTDAFDGLGISRSREPSPTLAEAKAKLAANASPKPPPLNVVSRTPTHSSVAAPLSPRIPASRTGLATYRSSTTLSVEERFPSLDDLNKGWRAPSTTQTPPSHAVTRHERSSTSANISQQPVRSSQPVLSHTGGDVQSLEPRGEARSQQVTGTAMRDGQIETVMVTQPVPSPPSLNALDSTDKRNIPIGSSPTKYRPSRPALARKHRSSVSIKPTEQRVPQPDWLTGDQSVSAISPADVPSSPRKTRASTILSSPSQASGSGTQGTLEIFIQNTGARYEQDIKSPQESAYPSVNFDLTLRQDNILPKTSSVEMRLPTKSPSRRQDSSSDDAEEPEDVNNRVVAEDIRKRRTKGRQSSVHDLVDLYGGSGRVPVERERTGQPSPVTGRKDRRTSGTLIDISSSSSTPSQSTFLSPASIVPESRAELAGRKVDPISRGERISPPIHLADLRDPALKSGSRTSPVALPSGDQTEKPRPQSMFLFPAAKSLDPAPNMNPSNGSRPRPSPRRGSISDMVDLYENLGGNNRLKDPPLIASKPVGLRLNQTPSPIASRFPVVSPTGVSFPIGEATGTLSDLSKLKPKQRRSPTASSFRDSTSLGLSSTQDHRNEFISRAPRRKSISPAKPKPAPIQLSPVSATSPSSKFGKASSLSTTENNATFSTVGQRTQESISSPSPERPYQGVGKLIDQWQKKTEEANALRHPAPRLTGRPSGPRALGRPK